MKRTPFPGGELRARREEMRLNVYEVFRKTRVPVKYIHALEKGDLRALPVSCYSVAFLRTYCQFLELDADRYVDTFRACSRPSAIRFLRRKEDAHLRAPVWMHDLMTWAAVLAILALGWITYNVVFHPQADVTSQHVEAQTVPPPASDQGF